MTIIIFTAFLAVGSNAISEAVSNQVFPVQFNQTMQTLPQPLPLAIQPETKRIEPWLPSIQPQIQQQQQPHLQQDLTQMHYYQQPQQIQQQQQQPQVLYQQPPTQTPPQLPLPQPQPQQQPSWSLPLPDNFYLPSGNSYSGPPTSTEFRSEHYPYPFEQNYPYPVSQPPIDTSLIPTAKHFVIVSFIGLLLLFAIIQNSIAAAKRKDALVEVLSNRRKRDILNYTRRSSDYYEPMSPDMEFALNGDARISCIQRTLCFENRKLIEDLGLFGKILAKYLTRSVQNYLKESSPGWDNFIEDAANTGLRKDDCDIVYRDCNFYQKMNNRFATDEEEPT